LKNAQWTAAFVFFLILLGGTLYLASNDDDDLASTFPSSRAIGTWANTLRVVVFFHHF
jgi:hypothetical protein